MKEKISDRLTNYLRSADDWSADRERAWRMALRTAWITAAVLGIVALVEAIAIIVMMPLKSVVPYTLLVDRQTGYVQALKPLDRETVTADKALTRSMLAQYVIARESFDIDSLQEDYRRVSLWSAGEARDRYIAAMQLSNPASPLARLPRRALIETEIRGISSLGADTVLVRFVTTRSDPGGQQQAPQYWQAVVTYRFSGAAMSAADRLVNPLGFQVLRYRRDKETMSAAEVASPVSSTPAVTGPALAATLGSPGAPQATASAQPRRLTP